MSIDRPKFQVKKNGYDRFAVDEAVENYTAEIENLQRKLALYQEQLVESTRQLEGIKEQYRELLRTEKSRKETADEISRLALREANDIVNTAHENADLIIKETLQSSRSILEDLSVLYHDAGMTKMDAQAKLEKLLVDLKNFNLPDMPDISWLKDVKDKMR
ncbi:MAG: DivIVA domain-containing protein [Solobacterium sp.]|nr:DivIVA domain-containing protein [Solobacterium sp.]